MVGVHNISDYAKVTRYLSQQEDVTDVSVKNIGSAGVLFVVHITGDVSRFQKMLANDGRLKAVDSALAQNAHRADLYYYW